LIGINENNPRRLGFDGTVYAADDECFVGGTSFAACIEGILLV